MINSNPAPVCNANADLSTIGFGIILGIIAQPVIVYTAKKATNLIRRITSIFVHTITTLMRWFSDLTFVVRLRSMGCKQCAAHHRTH